MHVELINKKKLLAFITGQLNPDFPLIVTSGGPRPPRHHRSGTKVLLVCLLCRLELLKRKKDLQVSVVPLVQLRPTGSKVIAAVPQAEDKDSR